MCKKIVIESTRENYNASDMYSEIDKTIPFVIQRPYTHAHLGISLSKKMKDLYCKIMLYVWYSEDTCMITM